MSNKPVDILMAGDIVFDQDPINNGYCNVRFDNAVFRQGQLAYLSGTIIEEGAFGRYHLAGKINFYIEGSSASELDPEVVKLRPHGAGTFWQGIAGEGKFKGIPKN